MRFAPSVVLAVALALAACTGSHRAEPPRPGVAAADPDLPLAPPRAAVQRACRRAGIACPTLLPLSSEPGPRVTDFSAHGTTLLSVIDPDAVAAPSGRPFGAAHLLVGETPRDLPVGGTPGAAWPPSGLSANTYASVGDLRIASRVTTVPIRGGGTFVTGRPPTILRQATVHGRPALVLRAAPYPQGGLHGGHIIVVWNAGGRGRLVSLHYDGAPLETRIRAALAIAASEVPGSPTLGPAAALALAILRQTATSASCRASTATERRRAPFGHTRLPLYRCLVTLDHRQGAFDVEVLDSGCFVAERQPPGQAIYGCGAGGASRRP